MSPKLVGKNENSAVERAAEETRFVAQLYIARKKVWEGRAASHAEASRMAEQQKSKYPNVRSTVVITEAPRD